MLASLQLRVAPIAAAILCVLGCDPSSGIDQAPIVGGVETAGDPGVVAILQGDDVVCSGTVIAPRVVLTAAHCVAGGDPSGMEVFVGASVADGGTRVPILDGRAHPDYDRDTLSEDLGLLLLAAPVPAEASPSSLFRRSFDPSFVGRRIRLVGFGQSDTGAASDGRKREGETSISAYDARNFEFGPDPAQTCKGDSGGPAFLTEEGVEYLVGVTSNGDPSCAEFGSDTRVDVHATFIDAHVTATAEGAAGFGERCYYDANCAEGTCVALAAQSLPACTRSCNGDQDCPAEASCQDGRCVPAGPLPGAFGAACTDAYECASGHCADTGDGARICSVRCFEAGAACPDGTACTTAIDDPDRSYCLPEPGCGCSGAARPGAWIPVLLLLLAAGRRRSRS